MYPPGRLCSSCLRTAPSWLSSCKADAASRRNFLSFLSTLRIDWHPFRLERSISVAQTMKEHTGETDLLVITKSTLIILVRDYM